jgi:hypothetical protein
MEVSDFLWRCLPQSISGRATAQPGRGAPRRDRNLIAAMLA